MTTIQVTPETSIGILQNEIAGLHRSIDALSGKMDQVMAMQVQIGVIQEQHTATRVALGRAFKEINDNRGEIEKLEGRVASIDLRVTGQSSSWKASVLIATVIFGIVQTFFWRQLDVIENTANRQLILDQRLSANEMLLREHISLMAKPAQEFP